MLPLAEFARNKFGGVFAHFRSVSKYDSADEDIGRSDSMSAFDRIKRRTTTSSSCSPVAVSPPKEGDRGGSPAIDAILKTLFGACTGGYEGCQPAHDNTENDDPEASKFTRRAADRRLSSRTYPTKDEKTSPRIGNGKSKMQHRRSAPAQTLVTEDSDSHRRSRMSIKSAGTPSRDECYYAQFYADDHARAAQAVLMARQREERESTQRRRRAEAMELEAAAEAELFVPSQSSRMGPQHEENIKVAGAPYRLSEIQPPPPPPPHRQGCNDSFASESEAGSVCFDDGISAISAHTLEAMAKVQKKQNRRAGVPNEEGFDITENRGMAKSLNPVLDDSLPPTFAKTERSSCTDEEKRTEAPSAKNNLAVNANMKSTTNRSKHEYKNGNRNGKSFSVDRIGSQNTHRSSDSPEISIKSTHSSDDFSAMFKEEEKQYWKNVVDEKESNEGSGLREQKLLRTQDQPQKESSTRPPEKCYDFKTGNHPYDAALCLTMRDAIRIKSKKTNRSARKLLRIGRKRGYQPQKDESPIRNSNPGTQNQYGEI